jgi:hypothetical protein
MSTTLHATTPVSGYSEARSGSIFSRFFSWCANEDAERHIGWVGVTVTTTTAIFFPVTMCIILLNGELFGLIIAAMASLALVVVTNLAALPTKYTIPFYFLGILIDVVAIALSLILK